MKKMNIILCIVLCVLGVGLIAGGICAGVLNSKTYINEERTIYFHSPNLTGDDAIVVPASGVTRRNITAIVYDNAQAIELLENPVTYTLDKDVNGVTIEDNMLIVSSEVEKSVTLKLTAKDGEEGVNDPVYRTLKIKIKKNDELRDIPANPIEKDGWTLYYNDEFDGNELDTQHWSPYYLRHWADRDERTKAPYFFEDGALVLRCEEGLKPWSSQDGNKVRAIMSYEKNYLHKFGAVDSMAVFNREIPTFDGIATKYGYYEIRLKMPNTRDGSHFAWWMVGTQDDMNKTATLSSEGAALHGHYSNETGEFDIIETTISSLKGMKKWRPVIHPNGTTDYEYLWVDESEIPGDPSNEYHIYGFEWDENGTKFYVDNQLVKATDRSPNYRMMTFLSTYATGGLGGDRGIYPKDTYIDYFRIYKKNEARKPTTIILNGNQSPDFLYVPAEGESKVQMHADVLNQYDEIMDAEVKWKLSETIDGFTPTSSPSAKLMGVSIDEKTGLITVSAGADVSQDVFVTAYVNDAVKQTRHIKLSADDALPSNVYFNYRVTSMNTGETVATAAKLYDQYQQEMTAFPVRYQLSADISATEKAQIAGVTLDANGNLTVDKSVPDGTYIVVTAKAGGKYNNQVIRVNNSAQ